MILVTGATGNVGQRVVEDLARAGKPVRAMVRDGSTLPLFEALGASAVVGDITNATHRSAALVGVTQVIACHSAYHARGQVSVREVDGVATAALVAEAVDQDVQHFVLLSHLGVDRPVPHGSSRLAAKREAELALQQQSRMSYTILRLAPLMTDLTLLPGSHHPGQSGRLVLFGPAEARLSPVSPADVARIATRCGDRAAMANAILELGGPETFTWDEIARVFEQVHGRRVHTLRLPMVVLTVLRFLACLLSRSDAEQLDYLRALVTEDFVADPATAGLLFDLALEDLATYLAREESLPGAGPSSSATDDSPSRVVDLTADTAPPRRFETEPARATEWPVAEGAGASAVERDEPVPWRSLEPPSTAELEEEEPPTFVPPATPAPSTQPLPPEDLAAPPAPPLAPDALDLPMPPSEPAPVDDLPEPVALADEPAPPEPPPAVVPAAEPLIPPDLVSPAEPSDAGAWSQQASFAGPPAEAPGAQPGKRPPVRRPSHAERPVVDADEG